MTQGELRIVTRGEFAGMRLIVGRVYDTLIELLTEDGRSFCSVTPQEAEQMTRPAEFDDTHNV